MSSAQAGVVKAHRMMAPISNVISQANRLFTKEKLVGFAV
jgi:hypothetical protein